MIQAPEKLRMLIGKMPRWGYTILCVGAILWLTLASKPLGDTDLPLFPGADKICHAIMFGGLAWCILLDAERRNWQLPSKGIYIATAVSSALFGILTECLQGIMEAGRSYDTLDFHADLTGIILFSILFIPISKWLKGDNSK